jgi:hypothetical protein
MSANPGLMQDALQGRLYDRGNDIATVVYEGTANGQVVLVTTEPLEGGSPVRSIYYVAEQDPAKAKAIVGALMAPNETVEAWGPLPEVAVKAPGIETRRLNTGDQQLEFGSGRAIHPITPLDLGLFTVRRAAG